MDTRKKLIDLLLEIDVIGDVGEAADYLIENGVTLNGCGDSEGDKNS